MDKQSPEFTEFLNAYIACALILSKDDSSDDSDVSLGSIYDRTDIALDTLALIQSECLAFATLFESAVDAGISHLKGYTWAQAGQDFWLNRNGHGAGFWDRELGSYYGYDIAEKLSAAAELAGPRDLYVGDDGYIAQSGHFVRAA